mgnify:CR=1 FL=1
MLAAAPSGEVKNPKERKMKMKMILNWKDVIKSDGNSFYNGGWVKKVTSVDVSKSNGYAFDGGFVNYAAKGSQVECADGLYIVCSVEGSRKNQQKEVAVYRITGDQVTKEIDWVTGNDWALKIRDQIAELLGSEPITSPDNIVIYKLSGADVRACVEDEGIKLSPEDFGKLVNYLAANFQMEWYDRLVSEIGWWLAMPKREEENQ